MAKLHLVLTMDYDADAEDRHVESRTLAEHEARQIRNDPFLLAEMLTEMKYDLTVTELEA